MEVKIEQDEEIVTTEIVHEENIKIEFITPDGVTSRIPQSENKLANECSDLSVNPVSLRALGGWLGDGADDDGLIPVYYPEGSTRFPCLMCSETFESLDLIQKHFMAKEGCQAL